MHFCDVVARTYGRFSTPVNTFLNCTMPALVNISVGSLRGTSGDDGTMAWPLSAKNFRKVDLISLTPLILVQSQKAGDFPQKGDVSRAPLLDKRDGSVQKACSGSGACRTSTRAVDSSL